MRPCWETNVAAVRCKGVLGLDIKMCARIVSKVKIVARKGPLAWSFRWSWMEVSSQAREAFAHGEEETEGELVRHEECGEGGCGGGGEHVRKVMWPRGNARGDDVKIAAKCASTKATIWPRMP